MNELLTQLNFREIFFNNKTYNRPEINGAIDHLANFLKKKIHSPSPFILLSAKNHLKTLIAYFAILKIGKIAVIHDPLSKSIEFREVIAETDPAAIIFINELTISFNYEAEIIFRPLSKGFIISSDIKDVCTIAYTNAEDGYSKGAMLTENNLYSEVSAVIKTTDFKHNSINCALIPYSHLYGFVHGILMPALAGGSALITEFNLLKISEIAQSIHTYKVSHLHTVPSVYYILSKIPNIGDLSKSIIRPYSGGIQLPQFIYDSFYQKTHMKIWQGYGLTECSPAIVGNYDSEGPVLGSFGKPFPGCYIKILKANGDNCTINEVGEIYVKGNMVFKGYLNHEEATLKVLKNGWFRTGDLGKMDKDGNTYFCGLNKNMINTAGNKVYPKKLERLIQLHKNILHVNIFSESSLLQGNVIGAKIKLKNSSKKKQEELKKWCLENINNTMLPKIYSFE